MISITACSSQAAPQAPSLEDTATVGNAEYNGDGSETVTAEQMSAQYCIYEKYGMTYDAAKNELFYNGKLVRWFEDYYPLEESGNAGVDFFNEHGIIDVYAVRDFTSFAKDSDGAIDSRGELLELKEFTQEEFNARDIEAIKNSLPSTASSGSSLSSEEIDSMLDVFKKFGVTYVAQSDQLYLNG